MIAKSFILTILLLQTVNQAYSTKCYICTSALQADCVNDPVPEKYALECTKTLNSGQSLTSLLNYTSVITSYASLTDKQCTKIVSTVDGKQIVSRGCDSIIANCDNYKKVAEITKVTLDSCNLCETDLCNSSSAVNAGIVTLMMAIFIAILSR